MNQEENQKIKEAIEATFDSAAKDYDTNRHFIISAKRFVELIEIEDSHEVHILDISTGTGNLAIELAKKFPKSNIYGVDISGKMLEVAKAKSQQLALNNVTFHQQDVENLQFQGVEFDIITCGYGLFFYPNMDGVLHDMTSRLKDGGEFIFSTFTTNAFEPYSQIFLERLKKGYNIAPPSGIEKRQLKTIEEIEEFASQVEHKGLNIHDIPIRYPMDIDELWKLFNSAGYKGLLNELDHLYEEFEKEYLEHLQTLAQEGVIDFNADSWISVVRV